MTRVINSTAIVAASTSKAKDDNIAGAANAGSVVLRGIAVALDTEVGQAFIADCCRNTEGLLCDADIKAKWNLSDEHWTGLANTAPLLQTVRAERDRRITNGDAAREGAQRHFAIAPTVLGEILRDELVSPRHRIEAAKELRQVAGNGPESQPTPGDKFIITIDLGGDDKLVYEKKTAIRTPSTFDDGDTP
jgi:hypothetical protein